MYPLLRDTLPDLQPWQAFAQPRVTRRGAWDLAGSARAVGRADTQEEIRARGRCRKAGKGFSPGTDNHAPV